jgi:membrane protein YqaA with SNARE-associated domain
MTGPTADDAIDDAANGTAGAAVASGDPNVVSSIEPAVETDVEGGLPTSVESSLEPGVHTDVERGLETSTASSDQPAQGSVARRRLLIALGLVGVLALNFAAYWILTRPAVHDWLDGLVAFIYPGVFLLSLCANLTVLIPVPYNGVLIAVLHQAPLPWLAALLAAAGSVLGELTGYAAGRAGRAAVSETRAVRWTTAQMSTPWRSFLFLLVFSAPPNPVFDMAGIAAGTLKVPLRIFLVAVFLGRCVRFLAFAYLFTGGG